MLYITSTALFLRSMYSIIYELQKRYLNSFPLIKEELCFENILRGKEEHYALTTLILDMKLPSLSSEEIESDENLSKSPSSREYKSKFKIQVTSNRSAYVLLFTQNCMY